jgi:hypothetical protein
VDPQHRNHGHQRPKGPRETRPNPPADPNLEPTFLKGEREGGENLTNQQIPPSHRHLLVVSVSRVGGQTTAPSGRRAVVYDRLGYTTGGNPVKAGPPLPVLKFKAASWWLKSQATGHLTERVSTGMRVSMPRPDFDDNDENEVQAEVTNHERLPKMMCHGVLGHMKRWKEKTFYKGKLD